MSKIIILIIIFVVIGGGYYYTQNFDVVDENRIYIGNSVEECSVIRFDKCAPGYGYFGDETGCGCELVDDAKNISMEDISEIVEDRNLKIENIESEDSNKNENFLGYENSDGVYKLYFPEDWTKQVEQRNGYEKVKISKMEESGFESIFKLGFIANPRYENEFGKVGGRNATYGEFDACVVEGAGPGPECILVVINVPLTRSETVEVRTDTSNDDEWFLEITYGVTTEEKYSLRDEQVVKELNLLFLEQEALFYDILNTIEFVKPQ